MAKPFWMEGLSAAQVSFLQGLTAEQAVCRGKRRHKFPGLVPGEDSDHIDITRVQGVYQVTERCERDCGRTISYEAGTDGTPDYSTARYGGWKVGQQLSKGLGLTVADDFEFMRFLQKQAVVDMFKLRHRKRQPERHITLGRIESLRATAGAGEPVQS